MIAGCGSDTPEIEYAEVTGKVTYNEEAPKMGTVTFQPALGSPTTGEIQSDGTYSLKSVIGPNKVMIVSREADEGPPGPTPEDRKEWMQKGPPNHLFPIPTARRHRR